MTLWAKLLLLLGAGVGLFALVMAVMALLMFLDERRRKCSGCSRRGLKKRDFWRVNSGGRGPCAILFYECPNCGNWYRREIPDTGYKQLVGAELEQAKADAATR